MTPEQREEQRQRFEAKNRRRREQRTQAKTDPAAAVAAELRRYLGGKFGRLHATAYNAYAYGTDAVERVPKVKPVDGEAKPKSRRRRGRKGGAR